MQLPEHEIANLAREMARICWVLNPQSVTRQNEFYQKQKEFIRHFMALGRQYDANNAP